MMKNKLWLSILLLVLVMSGCSWQWPSFKKDERKLVVATIFPLSDIASSLGGPNVKTDTIVGPGLSPHTYEPKPSDVAKLEKADLILTVGAGLDDWVVKMLKNSGIDESKILDVSKYVKLEKVSENGQEVDDPHYWLSPKRMVEVLDDIEAKMVEIDKTNEAGYKTRMEEYKLQLEVIDKQMADQIAGWSKKDIITFHDAYNYFAQDYGLKVAGTIETISGSEPTAQQIKEIEDKIKELNIKAVFAEPQLSSKVTETLKADLGLEIGILDPIGGVDGRSTYIGLMKYNLLELSRFLM